MASYHKRGTGYNPSRSSEFDLIDSELKKLDEEIQLLAERRRLLCWKRNTLVTINSLPEELLVEILTFAGKSWVSNSALMKLLWVCQWWRKIALESSRLWTWIGQFNSTQLSKWLSLSKHSSLHINFVNALPFSSGFTRELFTALFRVQTLRLGLEGINLDLKFFWIQPPYRLETLGLENVNLPTSALAQASLLRHLFLRQCDFRWEPDHYGYPHLVSFHLINPRDPVPLTTFLHLVRGMPQLRTLVLVEAFQESTLQQPFPVRMPVLSCLKVSSRTFEPYLQFLELSSCITEQTEATFQVVVVSPNPAQLRLILSRIASLCCTAARQVTQIDLWDSEHTDIRYGGLVEGDDSASDIKPVVLAISNYAPNRSLSSIQNATALCDNLLLGHLRTLGIYDPNLARDSNYHTKLIQLFGTLPCLKQLDIHVHSCMRQFLRAITTSSPDAPVLFPALKGIGEFGHRDFFDDLPQILLSFLDDRVKHELDITVLVFRKQARGWDMKTMEELRRLTGVILFNSGTQRQDLGLSSISLQNWRTD
ncbi:hypothetical protein BDN72DRAFT_845401 [Pluteus cervinus]|uniref:Uncharacterized protein n=1 Tax=Pluteus cervinus TaxID=181527 RepID=A0ACD3AIC4_9AGAR|nr:hypothetical protein BDN72DRAFT_845401 [Pluteus cervinus]